MNAEEVTSASSQKRSVVYSAEQPYQWPLFSEVKRSTLMCPSGQSAKQTQGAIFIYHGIALKMTFKPPKSQKGRNMFKKISTSTVIAALITGCASVPMESKEISEKAKNFAPPSQGQAGLYIYRTAGVGAALKKDILVDGKCVGESAQNVFFYEEVKGNQEHTIATESEFSPNEIKLAVVEGINYFIRQYIKMGVFVGGANLEVISETEGKEAIKNLEMAKKGTCGT